MSKTRAKKIKLLLFDVDGVMTDGKLWIFPNPPLANAAKGGAPQMIEAKGFHPHDGTAISLARLGGLKTGLITKRISETVALRARDLKLEYVYQGVMVKIRVFEEILEKEKITATQVACVGDDSHRPAHHAPLWLRHRRGQRPRRGQAGGSLGYAPCWRRWRHPRRGRKSGAN